MVTLNIQTNFNGILGRLDELQKDVATKALARSLNRTIETAKTHMARNIAKEYNITVSKAKDKLYIRRATPAQGRYGLVAVLGADSRKRSVNLIRYAARETKRGLTAKQLKTKGQTVISSKGFIANGGRTVFRRVGKGRLPIVPIQGPEVPQMFNTKRVQIPVREQMLKRFPEIFAREAEYYIKRFNGG